MDVVSLSPLRAASILWQPRRGGHVLTVVCKATYHLAPVESRLTDEQEYPNEDDNHWDDDSARSLYSPVDLVPFKVRADVVLVGYAYAARKEPVRSLTVRLVVGDINKAIEVFGERTWLQDGSLREGARFVKMPLRYERAAGGPETTNPVGMRLSAVDMYGSVAVPNLQSPAMVVGGPKDTIMEPIGFGPIAPAWPSRAVKLGRHAALFSGPGWNKQPLPEDIDPSFFNCAPPDQQIDTLRDNERIILENLDPEHPRLVTSLPGVHPRAFVERRGVAEDLNMVCDTLWIDTDRALCTLTWRGQVPLEHPMQQGRVIVAMEQTGQWLRWQDVEPKAGRAAFTPAKEPAAASEGRPGGRSALATLSATAPVAPPGPAGEGPASSTYDLPPQTAADSRAARPFSRTIAGSDASRPVLPFGSKAAADPSSSRAASITAESARRQDVVADEITSQGFEPAPAAHLPFGHRGGTAPVREAVEALLREKAGPAWLSTPSAQPPPSTGLQGSPIVSAGSVAPPIPVSAPPMQIAPPPVSPIAPPAMAPVAPPSVIQSPGSSSAVPAPPPLVMHSSATPPATPAASSSPWAMGGPPRSESAPSGSLAPSPNMTTTPSGPNKPATGGAVAASNAAAGAGIAWAASSPDPEPSPAPATQPAVSVGAGRTPTRDVIQLVWFDPESVSKIREVERWKPILDDLQPKGDAGGFDDEPPTPEPKAKKDRREVFGILTRAESSDPEGLSEAVRDAIKDDGSFAPPLIVFAGTLTLPFDELETAKATVTAAAPLAGTDKKLKDTIDGVNEILKTPGLKSSSGVAEGLTARVKEAFTQANRMLSPTYLDTNAERMLLDQRHYQRRTLFGELFIRGLLAHPLAQSPVVAYLPDSMSKELPMFQTLKVRVIAEVHPALDQYESSSTALRIVALGRALALPASEARR
jgi:hypothetical protein